MKKLFFGGSFDPPHYGHLNIAGQALAAGRCEEVVWFPALLPPHKLKAARAPFAHRLAMIQLLINGIAGMSVSDFEARCGSAVSYTIDTLRALEQQEGIRYGLLIGEDSLQTLHTWREAETLAADYEIVAFPRSGDTTIEMLKQHWPPEIAKKLHKALLPGKVLKISSTNIKTGMEFFTDTRHIIKEHEVPESILRYINEHKLYRK